MSRLVDGGVSCHGVLEVDETGLVHVLELGIQLHRVGLAGEGVQADAVVAVHLDGEVIVHTEGLGDRVVGEGIDYHVLAAEVAKDVGIIQPHAVSGEEGVLVVSRTIGIRNRLRIDLTAEISF